MEQCGSRDFASSTQISLPFKMPTDSGRKNGRRRASSKSGGRDKKDKKNGRKSPARSRTHSRSPSPGEMAAPPPPYPQTSDLQFSALMAAIEGVKVAHASQHEHLAAQVQEL